MRLESLPWYMWACNTRSSLVTSKWPSRSNQSTLPSQPPKPGFGSRHFTAAFTITTHTIATHTIANLVNYGKHLQECQKPKNPKSVSPTQIQFRAPHIFGFIVDCVTGDAHNITLLMFKAIARRKGDCTWRRNSDLAEPEAPATSKTWRPCRLTVRCKAGTRGATAVVRGPILRSMFCTVSWPISHSSTSIVTPPSTLSLPLIKELHRTGNALAKPSKALLPSWTRASPWMEDRSRLSFIAVLWNRGCAQPRLIDVECCCIDGILWCWCDAAICEYAGVRWRWKGRHHHPGLFVSWGQSENGAWILCASPTFVF